MLRQGIWQDGQLELLYTEKVIFTPLTHSHKVGGVFSMSC